MRVNVGRAKTDLSKVRIDPTPGPGARFLAERGSLAGRISIGEDFEFTDEELDEILDAPA
jgi:hypothetical protein